MKEKLSEYVYLDGMWLQEQQLLKLAMNVGNFALAEHYLCALLFDAVVKGKRDVVLEVNKIREHYGANPIPLGNEDLKDDRELRGKARVSLADEQARKVFLKMTDEEKLEVLRESFSTLLSDFHLFIYNRHWLGIYMVVRDRLLADLSQVDFIDMANDISPEDFPGDLRMTFSTKKNFGREIDEDDRGEVYYKMKHNPQRLLCDTFWDILKMTLLTLK